MRDTHRVETITIRGAGPLAVALFVGGLGTILYWVDFFAGEHVQASGDRCYLVFERAFPAADGWTAVAALAAAVGLWRGQPSAVLFGIAAGSGFIFLGLMDILYNLENGMYRVRGVEMAFEIFINLFCMTVGPAAIAFVWRHRRRFDP